VTAGFLLTTFFTWALQTELAENEAHDLVKLNLEDVREDILDVSNENLFELAESISLRINSAANVDSALLASLAKEYDVAEINLIDARGIITAIIGISAVLVLMPGVDLFQIMMTSQVINGVLLPVVLVFQVVIAADRHIMGTNRNGRVWNVLTWATIGVITVLTVVMFVLQAMGYSA